MKVSAQSDIFFFFFFKVVFIAKLHLTFRPKPSLKVIKVKRFKSEQAFTIGDHLWIRSDNEDTCSRLTWFQSILLKCHLVHCMDWRWCTKCMVFLDSNGLFSCNVPDTYSHWPQLYCKLHILPMGMSNHFYLLKLTVNSITMRYKHT